MEKSLFRREVVPFLLLFALLIVTTIITDFLLHQFNLVWLGRYLGIPGTVLILFSFMYSLRKRKLINVSRPRVLLNLHIFLAWFGSLLVLIHAGVHFFAILPWLALVAMLITIISGMTGKFLLNKSLRQLQSRKEELLRQGMSAPNVEKEIFWDALTLDLMKKWRSVHYPITLIFSVLTLGHILSILMFWQWQ